MHGVALHCIHFHEMSMNIGLLIYIGGLYMSPVNIWCNFDPALINIAGYFRRVVPPKSAGSF